MSGYGGVLLFCGITYGIATNMPMHASMCVLFQHFTSSNRMRASSLSFLGQSVVSIFLGLSYQKLTPLIGWRNTLRITSIYVLALGLPSSFFVKLKSMDAGDSKVGSGKQNVQIPTDQVVSTIGDKYQTNEKITNEEAATGQFVHGWLHFIKDYKVWCVAVAFYFPAMTWSVFWVNIVNFFESVGLHGDEILINMTVSIVAEIVGKTTLVLFIHRLPVQEVNLLIFLNISSSAVAAAFAFWPSKTVLLISSVFVGAGRGLYTVLPYVCAPILLNKYHTDQAITLAIMSTGLGYPIGSIPAGAIYEATNSYFYAFVANAMFCLFGATLLVVLQVHQHITEKKSVR
ncbi:hypothetical protein HOLleu_09050 [Holothuria leucospilota]|uniref:Uncharacterized protein n=1 Tax=Holothuria leucospilota TaxID=206669 RepID=A0A9Q1HHF8_HOLLE|nr:hypothetical protein HOLleu_09050 [Holothuria leucospilota]